MNAFNEIDGGEDVTLLVEEILRGRNQTRTTSETLPPEAYWSDGFFRLESEKIFREDWVCVGSIHQIPNIGDFFTIDLVGEAMVVVRSQEGVRVMSRACLHRWAPIASGEGNTRAFVCPFHKWVYDLDGQLVATPFMEQAENFDIAACKLPQFRTEIMPELGFIFVNISGDAPPLAPKLQSFLRKYGNWKISELVLASRDVTEFDFNWKIQIETAAECYHHIGAHPTTFEAIQPARLSSCDDSEEGWTVCHSPYKEDLGPEAYTQGLVVCPDLTSEEQMTCDYVLIYPNLFLSITPDGVFVLPVLPKGPAKCQVFWIRLVRPETLATPGMLEKSIADRKAFMDKAIAEDVGINVIQQQTLTSRYARPGRLSHLETTVWDLANYVRSRIGDAG